MAGTKSGGKQAARTNKARFGDDFYAKIGKIGGRNGHTGGFATAIPCFCTDIDQPHYKRNCAGKRGGQISRKPKKVTA